MVFLILTDKVLQKTVLYTGFLILLGCSDPYKEITKTAFPAQGIHEIPYSLPQVEEALIYKTDISFYQRNISGLLIIKRTGEQNYRIALTTQFGLKIFDFALNRGSLEVIYCIDYLNKNSIISTFEDDFNLLLMQIKYEKIYAIQDDVQEFRGWIFQSGKRSCYYLMNKENEQIERIEQRKRNAKKISVSLYDYKNNLPYSIHLEHHTIKLKMKLKRIQ
ncbi:MAG: hypothetical protein V2I54_10955 [Bacteroidales bacterium]|jgi:hypothetical protein|nr:hypothetical protein [Bacteroidales bacterium]